MRLYVASPLGFAESTRHFMTQLAERLSQRVEVINPWDDRRFDEHLQRAPDIEGRQERLALYRHINTELGRANEERIRTADGLIAVLDGVDVDSGTASEIGFAYALGKRVYGLRTDFRLAGDNEGAMVNLQVQYFIEASGGGVYTDVEALDAAIATWAE